jgi:vitamin B12 transporter
MTKKMYGIAALALGVVFVGGDGQSRAAEVSMMDEVVVTAGRIQETRKDVTSNITVVSREDIEQAVARSVGDLFAEMGISHIQKYPGALTSIAIRGFRTETHGNDLQSHVLVLLDGRRAGTGNLAKIQTRNIERIEIIRGPGAVQYGSGGVGGVVNIITRQGTGNSFTLETGGGSYDEYEGTLGLTVKEKGFDFAGTVTGQTAGDYETGGGLVYDNTGFDSQIGISLNGGYSFSQRNRVGLIFTSFSVDGAGNPGYISMPDGDDYTDKDNYSLDLRYDGSVSSANVQWMARYFFGQDENTWGYPTASNPDGWDFGTTDSNTTDQQGVQAQVTGNLGPAAITGGFDWVQYEVENTWTPQQTEYANPALFLLGKGKALDGRLIADVGLRYDWYDVEVSQPAGRDESDTRLTPSIGLAWLANDSLKLRARYAEGFVMPSADQLAADYMNWGIRTVGNPDLDPEKSKTYEAGVDYSKAGFDGSLTIFATDFKDKITNYILADWSSSWVNLGSATLNGFEVEMSYDLGVSFKLPIEVRPYLNLTVLTTYEDDTTGEDLLYISGTNYSTGLVVSDGDAWFCRFNVAYTGSQSAQDWESGVYPVPVVNLDSFVVADLTASYRFLDTDSYGRWSVRGEVRNIFDEDYAYVLGNPMPGRTYFAGLRIEY